MSQGAEEPSPCATAESSEAAPAGVIELIAPPNLRRLVFWTAFKHPCKSPSLCPTVWSAQYVDLLSLLPLLQCSNPLLTLYDLA